MNITSGLMAHMVLQRNPRDVSDSHVEGRAAVDGVLRITVTRKGQTLPGLNEKVVGKTARKNFAFRLAGIPTGGPYAITLHVVSPAGATADEITVSDVCVGDVWMLGGQSNMQGCALLQGSRAAKPNVRAFYMDDQWRPAQDPIHNMWATVDEVHITICGGRPGVGTVTGTGPGVSFGQAMQKATGIPQGLIASAHGGTSMSQWDPALKKQGSNSLYGAMLRRFKKNGSRIAGVLWYQGESDAHPDGVKHFSQRMKKFVRSLRSDMRDPKLPFIMVQISRVVGWGNDSTWWNAIQDLQRQLADSIPHCAVVPAIDLPLVDPIHISTEGHAILGQRLADVALAYVGADKKSQPAPLRLQACTTTGGQLGSAGCVEITFENVVGKLVSQGRPSGFSVMDAKGNDHAYRVRLVGNKVIIDTGTGQGALKRAKVQYGFGMNPHCNVSDEAGRALPVFGPVPLGPIPRPATGPATFYYVSELLPSAGKLHTLPYPKNRASLALQKRDTVNGSFASLHEAFSAISPKDVHAVLVWNVFCSEPMALGASLGYDGPIKVWANGRNIFHDPNGTNPSTPDERLARFNAKAGNNEILIALASNNGAAWGVFLSLERFGVPQKALLQKGAYAMPEFRALA